MDIKVTFIAGHVHEFVGKVQVSGNYALLYETLEDQSEEITPVELGQIRSIIQKEETLTTEVKKLLGKDIRDVQ